MNSANRDNLRRAVRARDHGQARIRSVTMAATTASVITAGTVTLILPGSAHAIGKTAPSGAATRTSNPAPSVSARPAAPDPPVGSPSANPGSANPSTGTSGLSPNTAPAAGSGSGQVTSGGT